MSKVFHQLYYHVIWTTYRRQPLITSAIEQALYSFLENKAKRFGSYLIAVNGTADHLHAALRIAPSESVSDVVGKLKGSSSYFLNKELQMTEGFSWQEGFGVLSFAEKDLPRIVQYIERQKEHHLKNSVNELMEKIIDDETPALT